MKYFEMRSEKRKDKELADMQYNITLLINSFHHWKLHKKWNTITKRNKEIAINYDKYILMNKYFKLWQNQYIIIKNQQQYEHLSLEWYYAHIKQIVLDKWIEYHRIKVLIKHRKSNIYIYIINFFIFLYLIYCFYYYLF